MKVEIQGIEKLIRSTRGLSKSLRRKHLRSAMRKANSIVTKAAKAAVVVGATGQLKRSLGGRVKVYSNGAVVGTVGARPGFAVPVPTRPGNYALATPRLANFVKVRYHDPVRISHLVELGTRKGRRGGSVRARPFLGPAFQGNTGRIEQTFAEEIDVALETL